MKHATSADAAHCRRNGGNAIRGCCDDFPEGIFSAHSCGKSVCRRNVDDGRGRPAVSHLEARSEQYWRRHTDVLSDYDGLADGKTQRWRNEPLGLGCDCDSARDRDSWLDGWCGSDTRRDGGEKWSTCRNAPFFGKRMLACRGRRCANAAERWSFRRKA